MGPPLWPARAGNAKASAGAVAAGVEEILLPGEPEQRCEDQRRRALRFGAQQEGCQVPPGD